MRHNICSSIFSEHEKKDRELFNKISYQHCQKDLLLAHRIARRNRLEQMIKTLPFSNKLNILEIGCGAGFSTKYLQGKYHNYCGIDYSKELIAYARKYNSGENIDFHAINIKDFKSELQFDVVLLIGALHHLDDIPFMMNHMVSFLKPGGWIVANEPHSGNPIIRNLRKIRESLDPTYSSYQIEFSIPQLYKIYKEADLVEIEIIPQGIFSTPLAEVIMPFQKISTLISKCACAVDRAIERRNSRFLRHITWNVSIYGRKPYY